MTEKKHDTIPCVGCCVNECKFNTIDNHCCAESISVRSPSASKKDETYCSTFCPRGSC